MKELILASNIYNERHQCDAWFENLLTLPASGLVIVDSGSTDGTKEFFMEKIKQGFKIIFVTDPIIRTEGYGPARNQLRALAKQHFPKAEWMAYFDADERVDKEDLHRLRFVKDYLRDTFDVVAFPRIDWMDLERTAMAKDWVSQPDYQARMTRLGSPIVYVRRLHEQITNYRGIYANIENPKINHFHRSVDQNKRDYVGKLCAKLHSEDEEYGKTMPKHHKEDMYYEKYLKEGLD